MLNPQAGTETAGRLDFIDALRGFALFGVFWANLLIFSGLTYMADEQRSSLFPSSIDAIAYYLEHFFIEYKFIGLFSFLFGISFWLFLSRVRARDGAATNLFYRRIFWLFVIGAIHGWLFWCFDVLRFYALWAILLPLFVRMPPRRLLGFALIAAVLLPAIVSAWRIWMPAPEFGTDFDAMALRAFSSGGYREFLIANWKYDWYLTLDIGQLGYQVAVFGRLLLGLYAARTLALGNLERHRPMLWRVLIVGGVVGVLGNFLYAGDYLDGNSTLLVFARRLLFESGRLGLTLFYAAGLAPLFLIARGRRVIQLMAPMGKMALTCYLAQTAFGLWMFYHFTHGPRLMAKVGPALLVAIAVLGFLIQIVCARAWLKRFRFGPAEWVWRSLTYWKPQAFRI